MIETLFVCIATVAAIHVAQRGAVNIINALKGNPPARTVKPSDTEEGDEDDRPLAPVIPLFKKFAPKETQMIEVNGEVQGLQQAIDHAQLMVDACTELGTPGGEAFTTHLLETDNGQLTIDAAYDIQQAFDEALPAAERLLQLLTDQLTVKEASDAIGGEHGSRAFLSGND